VSAKHKLNAAYFLGALLIAGLLGAITGSWIVFALALAGVLIAAYHSGDMRR
jgi:hypothetical protein